MISGSTLCGSEFSRGFDRAFWSSETERPWLSARQITTAPKVRPCPRGPKFSSRFTGRAAWWPHDSAEILKLWLRAYKPSHYIYLKLLSFSYFLRWCRMPTPVQLIIKTVPPTSALWLSPTTTRLRQPQHSGMIFASVAVPRSETQWFLFAGDCDLDCGGFAKQGRGSFPFPATCASARISSLHRRPAADWLHPLSRTVPLTTRAELPNLMVVFPTCRWGMRQKLCGDSVEQLTERILVANPSEVEPPCYWMYCKTPALLPQNSSSDHYPRSQVGTMPLRPRCRNLQA